MERELIYKAWLEMQVEGKILCDSRTINKCKKISDKNFEYYAKYQDSLFKEDFKIDIIKQRRSKILDFLLSEEMKKCILDNITQEVIDHYFVSVVGKESDSTYMTRLNYVKHFLDYYSDIIPITIKWEQLRLKDEEINTSQIFVKKALSAEQVSFCRNRYKNDLKKLFVFEMLYYTNLSKKEIGNLNIEDVDFIDNTINVKEKINVPESLVQLIIDMNQKGMFNKKFDVDYYVDRMKEELQEFGIENFKAKDVIETRKMTYWRCPQCGEKFEAIADNWCVRQYIEGGNFWIVCRENCGNE